MTMKEFQEKSRSERQLVNMFWKHVLQSCWKEALLDSFRKAFSDSFRKAFFDTFREAVLQAFRKHLGLISRPVHTVALMLDTN